MEMAGIRNALLTLEQRINTAVNQITTLDQRLTGHETVHDPYLATVDDLRNRVDNNEGRIAGLAAELNQSALTSRVLALEAASAGNAGNGHLDRIAILEGQVFSLASTQAQLALDVGRIRGDTRTSFQSVNQMLADNKVETVRITTTLSEALSIMQGTMTSEYPGLFTSLQTRATAIEKELIDINARFEGYVRSMPDAKFHIDLKAQADEHELGSALDDKMSRLEHNLSQIKQKIGDGSGLVSGSSGPGLEKREAIKQLQVFSNDGKVSFEKWTSVIKSEVVKNTEWKDTLKWAQAWGKQPISASELSPAASELGRELWALLGYKLDGDPWKYRRIIPDGHGLELWRRLCEEFDPRNTSEATVLKIALQNTAKMKDATEVKRVVDALEFGMQRYDAMASEPMSMGERHSLLIRVAPNEFVKAQLMAGQDLSEYSVLRDRLLTWARGDQEHRRLVSGGPTPMEIGAVGGQAQPASQVAQGDNVLAEMRKMQAQTNALLAAMVKGGGGFRPKGGKGGDKGNDGKPSGPPGKGPMVTLSTGKRFPQNKLRICRDYAKTGRCQREKCDFPHVSGLPKALVDKATSAEGLLLGALGDMPTKDGAHLFDANKTEAVLASLNSKPGVSSISPALDDPGWSIEGLDQATLAEILKGGQEEQSPFAGPVV